MPTLIRPDGAEIYWELRGQGPTVLLATNWWSPASNFEGLIADLTRDYTVAGYDPRGSGGSSRSGPYDPATDADDLAAVATELGGVAVCIGWGDGGLRGVRVAERGGSELVGSVVVWGNPLGPAATSGTDSMVDSEGVLEAFEGMLATNFRAAMRTLVTAVNPQLDDEAARERVDQVVAYSDRDAALARMRHSVTDAAVDESRKLGDRLWVLRFEGNQLLGPGVLEQTRELLSEAQLETLEDGAISRPDLTAAIVRRITARDRDTA
jgi:pimeloyl-ACP methyl ester carboxylesterase